MSEPASALAPEGPGRSFLAGVHGLRGLSALFVLLFHLFGLGLVLSPFGSPPPASIATLFQAGQFGVEIFFMISGLLITGSVIHHAHMGRFLLDRCIRIYPVFIVIHVLVFGLGPLFAYRFFAGIAPGEWLALFVENLLFLPGLFDLPLAQFNAWSLSFEAGFYLVAAAIYLTWRRWGALPAIILSLSIAAGAVGYYAVPVFFLPGIATYFLIRQRKFDLPPYLSLIALVAMGALLISRDSLTVLGANLLAAMPGFILILSVADGSCWLSQLLLTRPMQYLGTISYSLYLWHAVAMFAVRILFPRLHLDALGPAFGFASVFVLGSTGALISAHISHQVLEVRVARYLKARVPQATARLILS